MAHRSSWRLRRFAHPQRAPQSLPPHSAPPRRPEGASPSHPDATTTPPAHDAGGEPVTTRTDPSYPQPLQGFDYSFGAVG